GLPLRHAIPSSTSTALLSVIPVMSPLPRARKALIVATVGDEFLGTRQRLATRRRIFKLRPARLDAAVVCRILHLSLRVEKLPRSRAGQSRRCPGRRAPEGLPVAGAGVSGTARWPSH